ncbi:MAG: ankyrin repeat domain-containing protein, partial [Candidatus Anstonellales archaeon]
SVDFYNDKALKLLLDYNLNLCVKDKEGNTPLHLAAKIGNINAAEILLKASSELANVKNQQGWTHLHTAAFYGQINYLKKFIIDEKDLNIKDDQENIVIHILAETNKLHHLRDLVKRLGGLSKELLYTENKEGKTALHIALENENFESVKALLEFGATFSRKELKLFKKIRKFYVFLLKNDLLKHRQTLAD